MKVLRICFFLTLFLLQNVLSAKTISETFSIPFIENSGQHPYGVHFSVSVPGGMAYMANDNQIVYNLKGTVFTEEFATGSHFSATKVSTAKVNIYKETGIYTGLNSYTKVGIERIAENVMLSMKSTKSNFEKIFTVYPGGNPDDINVKINGAEKIGVINNRLLVFTPSGIAEFTAPVAWQKIGEKIISVPVEYKISGLTYGFCVGSYDTKHPLFIDPLLSGTMIGGNNYDDIVAMTVASNGDIITAGSTRSNDFPVTTAVVHNENARPDCLILRYDSSGTTLKAATFYGGSNSECSLNQKDDDYSNLGEKAYYTGLSVIGGKTILSGMTYSSNIPMIGETYDKTCANCFNNSSSAVFLAVFDEDMMLTASTFFGGSGMDRVRTATADSLGNIIIAGNTNSTNLYPEAPFAGGDYDVFAASFSSDLKTLNAVKMFGGSGRDRAMAVTANSNGIYLTGLTSSTNFPVTEGAHSGDYGGTSGIGDAFVAKLNATTLEIEKATYLGKKDGQYTSYGYAITTDSSGKVYVGGATFSQPNHNFPVTEGAYKTTAVTRPGNQWRTVGYIAKFPADLGPVEACTYLGSDNNHDDVKGLSITPDGNIMAVGFTASGSFPVTEDVYDNSFGGGGWDGFISILSPDLKNLVASTYVGGDGEERLFAAGIDGYGNPSAAGFTKSDTIPGVTGDAKNDSDALLVRIRPDLKKAQEGVVLEINPVEIEFGSKNINTQTGYSYIKIWNKGLTELKLNSVDIADKTNFSGDMTGNSFACSDNNVIKAGVYCSVRVRFTPKTEGELATTMTFNFDPSQTGNVVDLTGTGVDDSGDSGNTGNTGDSGNTGNTGDSGNTGNTGNSGDSGNSGNSGNTGDSGDSGNSDNTGDSGNTGNTGNSGDSGDFDEITDDENSDDFDNTDNTQKQSIPVKGKGCSTLIL